MMVTGNTLASTKSVFNGVAIPVRWTPSFVSGHPHRWFLRKRSIPKLPACRADLYGGYVQRMRPFRL